MKNICPYNLFDDNIVLNEKELKKSSSDFFKVLNSKKEEFNKAFVNFLKNSKNEIVETKDMFYILSKFTAGKKLTKEEQKEVKEQFLDILKIAGIWVPLWFIPGSSILLPFIAIYAKKKNINIIPSSFKTDNVDDDIKKEVKKLTE